MKLNLPRFAFPISLFGTAVGVAVLVKDASQGTKYEKDTKLSGRTVIVTGANSGIGKATALELAKRGGRVILACRDLQSADKVREEIIEESFNPNVAIKHLDLVSLQSIADFAKDINSSERRLDVLVNNAGVMNIGRKRQVTSDGFELHLGVNFLGPFLLTLLLLPKLQESKPARVVNVTTVSMNKASIDFDDFNGSKDYDPYMAYPRSKLALMSFTEQFSQRFQETGVTAYAVYPGVTQSRLARGMANSRISSSLFKPSTIFMRRADSAAQTILYCCLEPGVEKFSGLCLKDMKPMDTKFVDPKDATRLWNIAHVWTCLEKLKQSFTNPGAVS
ncbi:retinol dehydrogenase 13-like [Watersipora subatra]|uniref:retinol dehydrogenase 13-like n=1 Tax=Watersipora subatra TaxID=2589382 RepID=UPI00355B37D0